MTGGLSRGELVAAQAESWIDVLFHWQGRIRAGCDCKGLIAGVAAELGFAEADSLEALAGDYGARVPDRRLRAGLAKLFDRAATREAGDVLLCLVAGRAQHLAIAAPRPGRPWRAIEAVPHVGRVRPIDWAPHRVHSIWRWKALSLPLPAAAAFAGGPR